MKRDDIAPTRFPDAVELVVLAVRAGLTPIAAVSAAGRLADPSVRPAFDAFEHALRRGAAFADALEAFPDQLGDVARPFADGLARAERYGGALGPLLDQLAADARSRRRRQIEQAVRRLPVSMSFPLVVCTLPSFVLLAVVPAVLGAVSSLRGSLP
jgi:tight adherence protein C